MIGHAVRLASSAVLLALVVGCGGGGSGKTATVSGKVTVAGKGPLTGGNITFTPVSAPDKFRSAQIKGDGTYSVTDVLRGECKVSIENASLKGIPAAPTTGADMPGAAGGATKYMPIDPKLAKADTSGLTTNVDKDPFTYDVEVK